MKRSLHFILFLCLSALVFNSAAQTWQELGGGTDGNIKAVLTDPSDNSLFVAGDFSRAGSIQANRIARYNAGAWFTLGSGLDGQANALIIFQNRLFAGGRFFVSGGVPNNGVARWDGTKWLVTSNGMSYGTEVTAFEIFNNQLYAGTTAGVFRYNAGTWSPVSAGQITGRVNRLLTFNGELYAGGSFNMAGGSAFDYIAKYDGTSWSLSAVGTDGPVTDMYSFNSGLYVGGEFTSLGGVAASGIAVWDGTMWSAAGAEPLPSRIKFIVHGGELYAYGKYSTSPSEDFAKWTGFGWTTLTYGLDSAINSFAVYNGEICAGGDYTLFNELVPVRRLSRFTSVTLTPYTVAVPVTCNGLNDGVIKSTGYGGTRPYTYSWSTSETTSGISALAPGTYMITVTDAVSATAAATINITEPAVLTLAVNTTPNTCDGSACVTPSGGNSGYAYSWVPAPSVGQSASCITGTVGNYDVTVTDVKGCSATASAILTSTSSVPSGVVTASGPTTICMGDSVTLTASPADSYSWSNGLTAQSIVVKASGSYTVTVTNAGACSNVSPATSVSVITLPSAALTAGGPTTFCQFDSVILSTTANADFNYEWLMDGATIPSETNAVYKAMQTGSYQVRTYNICGSDTSASIPVTVKITPLPTASSPVNYCLGQTSVCLSATGANLLWYTSATGGIGSATCPVPSTASAGTTSYYVSQTANGCESGRNEIEVNVFSTPAPAVTSPVNYCKGETAVPLDATGTALSWYTTATGGTGSAMPFTPSTAAGGGTSYWVSQTENSCESPRSEIRVNVFDTPRPTAVDTVGYCRGAVASPLSATGTDLLWYTTATGGTGSSTSPTPSTAADGVTKYFVSQTLNSCESLRDSITVIVSTIAAPVTTPTYFCQGGNSTCLTATGSNLKWYVSPTGGVSAACIAPSTAAIGTSSYYVSQTVNGCESPRNFLAVTIRSTPSKPVVTDTVKYCKDAVASALTATGTSLKWYAAQTGGAGNAVAPIPSTTAVGIFKYYVSQTVNGCEGNRAVINVKINSLPKPVIASSGNTVFCAGSSIVLSPVTSSASDVYKWSTGSTQRDITVSAGGTYYLVLTNSAGCKDTSNKLTVTVKPLPTPVLTVNGPTTFCNGKYVILGTTQSYAGYSWSGGSTKSKDTVYTDGYHKVIVNDSLGCRGKSDSVRVTVTPVAEVPVTVTGQLSFCKGDSVTLTVPSGYLSFKWSNGMTTNPVTVKSDTSIFVEATDQDGCIGRSATRSIKIYPLPVAKITRAGSTLASNSASSYQWYKDGVAIPGEINQNLLLFSNGVYKVRVTNTHGCTSESDTVKINFVGITEADMYGSFIVYPNPFTDKGVIEYELTRPSEVTLEVYNALGSLVRTVVNGEKQYKGRHVYPLSASQIEDRAGVYLVRLLIDKKAYLKRFSKL
jgi:hypothetical protein